MSTDALIATATSIAPAQFSVTKPAPEVVPPSERVDPPIAKAAEPIPKEQLQAAVQQIQKFIADSQRTLEFQIDESSGTPVVTVRDSSGGIIRQIPSAETLHIAKMIKDQGSLHRGLIDITA